LAARTRQNSAWFESDSSAVLERITPSVHPIHLPHPSWKRSRYATAPSTAERAQKTNHSWRF
ncbi:hypothetical protein ABG768_009320, partial [Culter alburnus]